MCFTRTRSPVRTRQETTQIFVLSPCTNAALMFWSRIILNTDALGFHGVMVSTLDFESSDPSSNLGGTLSQLTPWRNGSASDSRSEGCVFESRRGHQTFFSFEKIFFCLQWGLNSWPLVYKTNALPLSYRGLQMLFWNILNFEFQNSLFKNWGRVQMLMRNIVSLEC